MNNAYQAFSLFRLRSNRSGNVGNDITNCSTEIGKRNYNGRADQTAGNSVFHGGQAFFFFQKLY